MSHLMRLVAGFPLRWPVFDPRSGHAGLAVSKIALVVGFHRVLRFPLAILIPQTAPHATTPIIQGRYNRPNTDPVVRVRFPALPDFLRSSGSGTGSTQPRDYN
jgi:hypothetical protein